MPEVNSAQETASYVRWFADYGFYCGTYQYTYDLMKRQNGHRYGYSEFSVNKAVTHDEGVSFAGSYKAPREIAIEHGPVGGIVLSHRAAEPRGPYMFRNRRRRRSFPAEAGSGGSPNPC